QSLLTATIPYFAALLGPHFLESGSDEIDLSRCDFDSAILRSIIDYAYYGCITLERKSAQQLMRAASFFQMDCLVDAAASYLLKTARIEDVIPLMKFFDDLAFLR
ncbi:hypothetical protein PMAYCL1PPCAC_04643, partial [Pristionchus mayeri]